jgi:2-dehydro-3-deoxygluconokinase
VGGAEANTAIGLARLGHHVSWISAVGDDPAGDVVLDALGGEGVDLAHVRRTAGATTGLMLKEVTGKDARVFYYRRTSAAADLAPSDVDADLVVGAAHVHVSGIPLALGPAMRDTVFHVLELCRDAGIPVSFDPNFRPLLWSGAEAVDAYRLVLPRITSLLLNAAEARMLTGHVDPAAAALALARQDGLEVVVKLGERGALCAVGTDLIAQQAVPAVAVDPVGAGDAFNAGWISLRLRGHDRRRALRFSCWVASHVVASHGDYEGFPSGVAAQEYVDALEEVA